MKLKTVYTPSRLAYAYSVAAAQFGITEKRNIADYEQWETMAMVAHVKLSRAMQGEAAHVAQYVAAETMERFTRPL